MSEGEAARALRELRRVAGAPAGAPAGEEAVEFVVLALAARGVISPWDAAAAVGGALPAMCALFQPAPGVSGSSGVQRALEASPVAREPSPPAQGDG